MSATMSAPTVEKLGPKVFGFWSYDLFPFTLGAEGNVIETTPKGRYRDGCFLAKGYGGTAFKNATIITDLRKGREIKGKLDDLTASYHTTVNALKKTFLASAKEIAPFIK